MSRIKTKQELASSGGVLVMEAPEANIWEFPERECPPWRNFYLRRPGRKRRGYRRSIYFGFNGERLARNSDIEFLQNNEPDFYAWLIETMENLA